MKKLILLSILALVLSSCTDTSKNTESTTVETAQENVEEITEAADATQVAEEITIDELEEDEVELIEGLFEDDDEVEETEELIEETNEATTTSKFLTKNLSSYSFETESGEEVAIHPIGHATAVVDWSDTTFYVDPAEALEKYDAQNEADVILITHIHGDHLKAEVLEALYKDGVTVIVPNSVNEELSDEMKKYTTIMDIETSIEVGDFTITSVPAYNIREEAFGFHPEERKDNGYIIEKEGSRVYFAGDTEDTPEMRALENIDVAFLPMNLPYTMTAESAASAVLDFAPSVVFPYHYRGKDEITDLSVFEEIVNEGNSEIEVVLHDWYGE